jgi:hypothetical protein
MSTATKNRKPRTKGTRLDFAIGTHKADKSKSQAPGAPPELWAQLRNVARQFAELEFTAEERQEMPKLEISISDGDADFVSIQLDDLNLQPATAQMSRAEVFELLDRIWDYIDAAN